MSGNVYATWTKFVAGATSRIEFARSTTGGTSWSAPQVLSAPAFDGFVAGARDGKDLPLGANGGEHIFDWYFSGTERVRGIDLFRPERGPNRDILGPYSSREDAARALEIARERTEKWDAEDRDWEAR